MNTKDKIQYIKDLPSKSKHFRWMFGFAKPFLFQIAALIGIGVATTVLDVQVVVASKDVIDKATSGVSTREAILISLAFYAFLALVNMTIGIVQSLVSIVINEKFSFSVRSSIFSYMLRAKWKDITRYHSGDLLTRLTSDVNTVASGILEVLPTIITLGVRFVYAFIVLAQYDRILAVIALIIAPLSAVVSRILSRKLKRLQLKVQESESVYRSFMQESLTNISIVKAFGYQENSIEKLTDLQAERYKWIIKRNRMSVKASLALNLGFWCSYLFAFGWSAIQLSVNAITYGTMTLFMGLVSKIQGPISGLARTVPQVVSMLASAERVMEIESITPEPRNPIGKIPDSVGIDVINASFAYEADGEDILKNASIRIQPGDSVAVIGSSGVGKTTLVRMIMKFLDLQEGSLTFFDKNGGTWEASADTRDMIAYVPQGNTLLSGSIEQNLRMGKPDATDEQMRAALEAAGIDKFVYELPKGIKTMIGERGYGLSEGQAQRIAIARAMIRNSPFLILDESTSALDEKTEMEVLSGIRSLKNKPTCFVITHRSSVLKICNRQIKIDSGKIMEIPISQQR